MFKNILLPIDGSTAAVRTTAAVAELAQMVPHARVTLLVVIHPYDPAETEFGTEMVLRQNERMREKAASILAEAAQTFRQRDISCETKVLEGQPVSTMIAKEAAHGEYDAIAMGSRGMSLQKDDLHYVGSVTEHVIRRVSIPVLVIPINER